MSRLIIVDCDDTLLHWKDAYFKWVGERGWKLKDERFHKEWDLSSWFEPLESTGKVMTSEDSIALIKEFNSYPRCLKPFYKSKETLARLKALGYTVIVLTSFTDCPEMTTFRKEYLNIIYPDIIKETIVLELGECKRKTLENLMPDYFIDDNKQHAKSARDLGIKTIVPRNNYNTGLSSVLYVDNWLSIYSAIFGEYLI